MTKPKRCTFCPAHAVGMYDRTKFCAGHLTLFYLSLNIAWHD